YTTALPPHSLINIKMAYAELGNRDQTSSINNKIQLFKKHTAPIRHFFIDSESPIQCLLIPGNKECRAAAKLLQNNNLDVRPILSPTVKEGKERLRICLHTFNTEEEIVTLSATLKGLCLT